MINQPAYVLSVIIVTYNNAKLLETALLTVLAELPEDVEVVIVNDGSHDNSEEVIRSCTRGYSSHQIRYIWQANQGVSVARNAGLDHSTGSYIAFIDGDDLISHGYFSQIMPILRQQKYDLLEFVLTRNIDDLYLKNSISDNQAHQQEIVLSEQDSSPLMKIFEASQWHLVNKIFHRDIFGSDRFAINRRYEDMIFVPFQYLKCKNIITIDTVLYYYRLNTASITENLKESDAEDIFFAMRKMCDFIKNHPQHKKVGTWMIVNCFLEGRKILRKKKGTYIYSQTMLDDIKQALLWSDSSIIPRKVYRKMRYTKVDYAISKLKYCLGKFFKK